MTPGLPTVRWTTSILRLAAMAGVVVNPPRRLCRIAAAAPGWPSTAAYWADVANRPKSTIAAAAPDRMPSGMNSPDQADEVADQDDDGCGANAGQRDQGQRPGVALAHDARNHADLLDPPHRCGVGRVRRLSAGLFHHDGEDTGPARLSIAWRYSRPARYDERTSGPDCTPAKPSSVASSASSSNSCGGTHRSIG